MSSEQLLKIMIDIQKKVEGTASITTEEVMQDLIGRLKECQSV
ncbi:hypothetical protein [Bacillus timonensis]|nr:hypothetical protein [Bacillus timonensis]